MRFIEVKAEEIAKNAKKYDGKEVVIFEKGNFVI